MLPFENKPRKEKPPPDDAEILAQLRKMNAERRLGLAAPEHSPDWRKHDAAFQDCFLWFQEHKIAVYLHKATNKYRLGTDSK